MNLLETVVETVEVVSGEKIVETVVETGLIASGVPAPVAEAVPPSF